jgi:Fic family protein
MSFQTPQTSSSRHAYVWQHPGWPALVFDASALEHDLNLARLEQGRLLGQMQAIGLADAQEIAGELWVQEAMATAAIEGEKLNLDAVRSSVCRRLGLADLPTHDRYVDGLIELMQDATEGYQSVLDEDRLCRWQAALFPTGTSGLRRIAVGRYRDHADEMQIVSGPLGREVVHYTAPASGDVAAQMQLFLAWFEETRPAQRTAAQSTAPSINGIARAAIAHLWFESIHPFEDGNGRVGRAIVDMAIAQDIGSPARLFGLSRQMFDSRTAYYDSLNQAQRGGLDITPWVQWFVRAFTACCIRSQAVVTQALQKTAFRLRASGFSLNERQSKVLARLLEAGDGGFVGGMTADKYSKITSTAKATATRDLTELLEHGLLTVTGVGKATRYAVNVEGWNQGNAPG